MPDNTPPTPDPKSTPALFGRGLAATLLARDLALGIGALANCGAGVPVHGLTALRDKLGEALAAISEVEQRARQDTASKIIPVGQMPPLGDNLSRG